MLGTSIMFVLAALFVMLASDALGSSPAAARPAAAVRKQTAPQQPAEPAATRPALAVTPASGQLLTAADRDARRLSDLQAIATALQAYRQKKGGYPSTEGRVQTACVFQNLDKACEVKEEVGLDRMVDVRGSSSFGYWYTSTGKTFTLFASLEGASALSDPCPDSAAVIKAQNVFCLKSHAD